MSNVYYPEQDAEFHYYTYMNARTSNEMYFRNRNRIDASRSINEYYSILAGDTVIKFSYDFDAMVPDTVVFKRGEEKLNLVLVDKKYFDIDSLHIILYFYTESAPDIDASNIYVISQEYGLMLIRSATWDNFLKLHSVIGDGYDEANLQLVFDQLVGYCLRDY